MQVIGIGNKARQGKSTLAEGMKEQYPDKVLIQSLADELKVYCRDHHDELFAKYPDVGTDKKDDPIYGYTRMLQFYGTEVVRKDTPDAWCKALERGLPNPRPSILVVPDVRFPNEAKWVLDQGGILVKVVRMREDGTQYIDPLRDPKHDSEVALDDFEDWDFVVVVADGKIDDVREAGRIIVQEVVKELGL